MKSGLRLSVRTEPARDNVLFNDGAGCGSVDTDHGSLAIRIAAECSKELRRRVARPTLAFSSAPSATCISLSETAPCSYSNLARSSCLRDRVPRPLSPADTSASQSRCRCSKPSAAIGPCFTSSPSLPWISTTRPEAKRHYRHGSLNIGRHRSGGMNLRRSTRFSAATSPNRSGRSTFTIFRSGSVTTVVFGGAAAASSTPLVRMARRQKQARQHG